MEYVERMVRTGSPDIEALMFKSMWITLTPDERKRFEATYLAHGLDLKVALARLEESKDDPDYNAELIIKEILALKALNVVGRKYGFGVVATPQGIKHVEKSQVVDAQRVFDGIFRAPADFEFDPAPRKSWRVRLGAFTFSISRTLRRW